MVTNELVGAITTIHGYVTFSLLIQPKPQWQL